MGLFTRATDAAGATGERGVEEAKDMRERIAEQLDAMKADAEEHRAELEPDAAPARNDEEEEPREDD